MSPVLDVQRRMMELGRIRLGEKGAKGEPKKLSTFRLTSASRELLESAAKVYGGKVSQWEGAPDDGYFQVTTEARELKVILPPTYSAADGSPTTSYSQWYELWSGGGCQRRCDGQTEALTGKPCMCNPDDRACQITTRVSVMLPEVAGLGVWRLDSKGWNAAVELPGTLEVLMMAAARNSFVPAVLRIEHRTKKEPGKGTHRFVVPVLDLPDVKIGELLTAAAANHPLSVNGPSVAPERPGLPAAGGPPAVAEMADPDAKPEFGEPPDPSNGDQQDVKVVSGAQVKLLWTTIRERGVPEDEVRRILAELTGQESTKAVPAYLFDAVLAAVQAVEVGSAFQIPDGARA